MPNLHHQNESKSSVKACTNIKLERDLGPEILAALADSKTIKIMLNSVGKSDYPLNQAPECRERNKENTEGSLRKKSGGTPGAN